MGFCDGWVFAYCWRSLHENARQVQIYLLISAAKLKPGRFPYLEDEARQVSLYGIVPCTRMKNSLELISYPSISSPSFKVVRNSFSKRFQLNFMKGLLVCSKRLLLLVDIRCCNNLSTYQLLYSHWHFGCHGNLTGPQIRPISSIQLHFTQKVAGELPFLLH